MLLSAPAVLQAAEADFFIIEQVEDDINIAVNGQSVTVSGAQGLTLEVVSLTGRRLSSVKIESPAQRIELNIPKGCYILKVGKVVRKVSIR
jgi:hypothetical protein